LGHAEIHYNILCIKEAVKQTQKYANKSLSLQNMTCNLIPLPTISTHRDFV